MIPGGTPGAGGPPAVPSLGERDEAFIADPFPCYGALRARGPVHRVRLADGRAVWLVVGHDEARAALVDPRLSREWVNASPDYAGPVGPAGPGRSAIGKHLLIADPPDSARLRGVVLKAFSRSRVESLAPRIRRATDGVLGSFERRGRADLVADFAEPLVGEVVGGLVGVPLLERDAVARWTHELAHPEDVEQEVRAAAALTTWVERFSGHKRRHPGDDLASAFAGLARDDPGTLAPDEVPAMVFLVLIAGYRTSVHFLSNALLALLRHPEQLADLRADWSLLGGALEEAARYDGPANTTTVRFTLAPVELGGVTIPGGGQPVCIALSAADRDPSRFPDPDRFDIRRDTGAHLGFGRGGRYCAGAPLARTLGAIAVRTLLERFPDLHAAPDEVPDRHPGLLFRGLRRLPVGFTPRARPRTL
ncbi:cytochrome P450 [Saccharothrix yanglingensis]|uniref:cytochrome P450 n=1 Tax=Saccharothrix yanglingensis TaxID=659496 RepID=UPI0027D24A08|nr:cytochrome P450 [Saccharothrix yanglingensis]